MWNPDDIRERAARSGQGATRVFTVVQSQPSWITRFALTVGLLVFTGVLLILVIPALLLATAVFLVLALISGGLRRLRSLFGADDTGRRNVRIVARR